MARSLLALLALPVVQEKASVIQTKTAFVDSADLCVRPGSPLTYRSHRPGAVGVKSGAPVSSARWNNKLIDVGNNVGEFVEKEKAGIYCQRQKDDLGGITTPTPIMYIRSNRKNRLQTMAVSRPNATT